MQMDSQKFYEVMDIIEELDVAITDVNDAFGEAMLSLAYIQFINPHSSISTSGFQPTPALLRYSQLQHRALITPISEFAKPVSMDEPL
jgi:hypothetical protein